MRELGPSRGDAMTDQGKLLAWRATAFTWLAGFWVMFVMLLLALNDRDDARRIRAIMGVEQLVCTPIAQAGHQRQLSPHEQEDNGPTPAGADRRWDEERYSL